MKDSIYIYDKTGTVVVPMSDNIKALLEFKAAANGESLSETGRKIIGGLCDRLDIPFDYTSLKEEARRRDRDVQGFVDNWCRENMRIKISDFLAMDMETRHKFLNFAKTNIFLTSNWTINALGYIHKGWKDDLSWPVELKHTLDEYLSMLREARKQALSDGK
jgi:hypothetical protein